MLKVCRALRYGAYRDELDPNKDLAVYKGSESVQDDTGTLQS